MGEVATPKNLDAGNKANEILGFAGSGEELYDRFINPKFKVLYLNCSSTFCFILFFKNLVICCSLFDLFQVLNFYNLIFIFLSFHNRDNFFHYFRSVLNG